MIEDTGFSEFRAMTFPRNVIVGHDTLPEIPNMCEQFGFAKNGMIITGDNTYKAAGRTVKEYMEDSGYDMHVQDPRPWQFKKKQI